MYVYISVYIQKERENAGSFVDMYMYICMYICICQNRYIYSRKGEREGSFVGRELEHDHIGGCCCCCNYLGAVAEISGSFAEIEGSLAGRRSSVVEREGSFVGRV